MQIKLGKALLWLTLTLQLLNAYTLQMQVNNPNPMLGEKVTLTVDFVYDNVEEYEVKEAQFANVETTLVSDDEFQEGNQTHNRIIYTLRAQKEGGLTLLALQAHIEMIPLAYQDRYNKNKYLKKFDINSNPLTLEVQPLPQALTVWGDYTMHASVDKTETTVGEPIRFTVTLQGEGNINNLDFLTLDIPHVLIYEKNRGLTKEFSIVPEKDFTIPTIALKYYNLSSHTVMLLSTPSYQITVKPKPVKPLIPPMLGYIILLVIFGALFFALHRLFSSLAHLDKKATFIKALKKCKTKEELLAKVAPYLRKDRRLDRLIYKLEGVEDVEFVGVKREIIRGFKHIKIL